MTTRPLLFVPLLLVAACDGSAADDRDPPRDGAGKADLAGSCAGSDCNGPAPGASCWCDELCVGYGDCCADKVDLCDGWTVEVVASGGITGQRPSLVLDAAGAPRISFYDFDNTGGAVRYATRGAAGDWSDVVVTAPSEHILDAASALAIDGAGAPNIVYRARSGFSTQLRHRELVDGIWHRTLVDSVPGSTNTGEKRGRDPSVVVLDRVHALSLRSRFDQQSSRFLVEVRHHHRLAPASWQLEIIDTLRVSNDDWTRASALVADAGGALHVAYSSPEDSTIYYAHDRGGAWEIEPVAVHAGGLAVRPQLAVGADGSAHIAYTSRLDGAQRVHHARRTGDGWSLPVLVGAELDAASSGSVAVAADSAGRAHLAFKAGRGLHYARIAPGAAAQTELVDAAFDVGSDPAIALFEDGLVTVHIAYHDDRNRDLKYARKP